MDNPNLASITNITGPGDNVYYANSTNTNTTPATNPTTVTNNTNTNNTSAGTSTGTTNNTVIGGLSFNCSGTTPLYNTTSKKC